MCLSHLLKCTIKLKIKCIPGMNCLVQTLHFKAKKTGAQENYMIYIKSLDWLVAKTGF